MEGLLAESQEGFSLSEAFRPSKLLVNLINEDDSVGIAIVVVDKGREQEGCAWFQGLVVRVISQ